MGGKGATSLERLAEMLPALRCPETRSRLTLAEAGLVERINRAIAAGKVRNRGGQPVATPLDGGLVREDGLYLYPVIENIPNLLIDRSIPLSVVD